MHHDVMPHELMEKEGAAVAALSDPNRVQLISARLSTHAHRVKQLRWLDGLAPGSDVP
jgi:hypothetical protein